MTPDTPQIPTDPNLAQEQSEAQTDLVNSLQNKTQGDMSSLMARYGTQLAMSGNPFATSPLSPVSAAAYGKVG